MKKILYIIAAILLVQPFLPFSASASILESNNGPSLSDTLDSWTKTVNDTAPTVSFLFSAIFTIMFLAGVVRMGYSIVTKTGQIMKGSTGILIWVPVTFFMIRVFVLLLFTTESKSVTLLASDIINLIRTTGYFTSLGMILIGLILFFFYKLIEHPEYGRWGKRLWLYSAFLTLLTTIMPFVLGAA